jgi:hypothetical protein
MFGFEMKDPVTGQTIPGPSDPPFFLFAYSMEAGNFIAYVSDDGGVLSSTFIKL